MLNFQMKLLFYYVPLASGIGMACSGPVIKTFMYANVSPEIVSLANVINVALTILINGTIHSPKTMEFFRKEFTWLAITHTTCFTVVSLMGEGWPEVRFIGFAILEAITWNLYMLIFRQSMNRVWNGDELTKLQFDTKTWSLVGALIGGGLVLVLDLDVHQALWLQAITCAMTNGCNMVLFKTLKASEKKEEVQK